METEEGDITFLSTLLSNGMCERNLGTCTLLTLTSAKLSPVGQPRLKKRGWESFCSQPNVVLRHHSHKSATVLITWLHFCKL